MQYGEIVTRALAIAWRHKYLWLLALFAGEGAAGVSFSSSYTHVQPAAAVRSLPLQPRSGALLLPGRLRMSCFW